MPRNFISKDAKNLLFVFPVLYVFAFGLGLLALFPVAMILVGVFLLLCLILFCLSPAYWIELFGQFVPSNPQYLKQQSASWTSRHRSRVCRYADKHGFIESLTLSEKPRSELKLNMKILDANEYDVFFKSVDLPLPKLSKILLEEQSFATAIRKYLKSLGVEFANEISVEHEAMRSAEGWMNELHWSREALKTLSQMDTDLKATLQMAPGYKLLESSIPAMEDAQKRTQSEYVDVKKVMNEATDILRQLVEFLSIPASIRGVLSFDKTYFYDADRHKELRQSFDNVVLLNNTYRDLCSQRII